MAPMRVRSRRSRLSMDRRQVLECGGWRGTGLTPLWLSHCSRWAVGRWVRCRIPKRCVPSHPPQSKTLTRDLQRLSVHGAHARPKSEVEAFHGPPPGFGVRWLAGNRADTAFAQPLFEMGGWPLGALPHSKAVCALTPHPPQSKTLTRD